LWHTRHSFSGYTSQRKQDSVPGTEWEKKNLEEYRQRAQDALNSHFGVRTLFIRYVFPAVMLGMTGLILLSVILDPGAFLTLVRVLRQSGLTAVTADANTAKILLGIKLGAIGAYTFVLLELGRRTFRHDITGASAMWCLVSLILGPVLAAAVAVLWRIDGPQESEWWGGGLVLFFTGFAPRRVIAAIEQAALQLLKLGSGAGVVVQNRLVPLNKIRGISPQIEERLSEEGIIDVNSLAEAEPIRLVRNTSFDMRQILSWIDEAILMDTLPKYWEVLEEEGITGAMDLAWYGRKLKTDEKGDVDDSVVPPSIEALAKKANMDPSSLLSAIERLLEDTQVRYVWALYNNFTEFAGNAGEGSGATALPSTPGSEALP
jgi:hypothetical protein